MFAIFDIPANYKFLVHTHSHIALLGWVYTALMSLLMFLYCREKIKSRGYNLIFWFTQITIVGMLFSFPFTGYALFSIIFSSLFLIASYFFAAYFFKNVSKEDKKRASYKLVRASIWFLIISSIGPWSLGYVMTALGKTSPWYRNAIYFFLHFQYNGWFLLALTGIFLFLLEQKGFKLKNRIFRIVYYLLNSGIVLGLFLSGLWMKPAGIFYILAALGGLLQLIAYYLLFRSVSAERITEYLPKRTFNLFKIAALLLAVKLFAQLAGAVPVVANMVTFNPDLVIAYLHWIFLGIISLSILAALDYHQLLTFGKISFAIYIAGFILTEILISYRGIGYRLGLPLPDNSLYIVLASILLLMAVTKILVSQFYLLKKTPK
ncbi:hypothetical protein C7S20_03355 [Christiangramia fulva]|uniref:NnrS family protein n=1 Tax=Christiangramia fulva TaxID=2126553 RepID=A0A2R3Z270_9FLAO|nr:hypothetical protein C7S20_03355 [Christiangramia fulva]